MRLQLIETKVRHCWLRARELCLRVAYYILRSFFTGERCDFATREIIMKLHDEIQQHVVKSGLREQLIKNGYDVAGLGPDEFSVFMKREMEKWAKVIKIANVKIE